MNAWTTLISRLAVDRKPIPPIKASKIKREVISAPPAMTRKEICMKANKALQKTRSKLREQSKARVYAETVTPVSADEICENISMAKPYVRKLLLELIDEGKVIRYKVTVRKGFYRNIPEYHYARP